MTKSSLITLCFSMFIVFSAGCQSNDLQAVNDVDNNLTEEAPAQERSSSQNGVTITTEKDQYLTSFDKIIVEIQNDSNAEYMTGAHVFLEKKVEDVWYSVPMAADSFTEEGIVHPPGELSALGFDVDDLKYELTPGQYRATIGGLVAPFEVVE